LEKLQQKTRKYVYLPLNELARSVIPKERGDKNGLVFEAYKIPNTYLKHLRRWVADAGIKDKNIVFHSARHTFATLLYNMGAPLDVTKKTMGHTAIESTTAYTHILDEKKIEVTDRINRLFEDRLKRRIVWCEKKK
jgi:Site-specific recombinase XerD